MKPALWFCLAVIASVAYVLAAEQAKPVVEIQPSITLGCRIIEVYDGDTVVVEFAPMRARVRLLDCWAPEVRTTDEEEKSAGVAAKDHLRRFAEGCDGVVTIPLLDVDIGKATSHGRVLGRVVVNGVDLSDKMVNDGFARKQK